MEDVAELRRQLADLSRQVDELSKHRAALDAEVAKLRSEVAERDARIFELEAENERLRRKGHKPQANRKASSETKAPDKRTIEFRRHPGVFREPPRLDEIPPERIEHHDVTLDLCPCCGGKLIATGVFDDHMVVDIPEPKPEYHRYRRHEYHCGDCGKTVRGQGDLEIPGSHIGPRARLLINYSRAHLGISLGKSCDLLDQLFGISLSRAGALGHLAWGSRLFDPVVTELLKLLRESALIHADETGWRINGKNVWAWCFSNPRIAVYLIKHSRGSQVLKDVLGDTLPGVLVTDFHAAYNCINAKKQRCLVHLLRELRGLRDKLPAADVESHVAPLVELFQDAIDLGKRRTELAPDVYDTECAVIYDRFGDLATTTSENADVRRIHKRLHKYVEELFTFLEVPGIPADNNPAERDIRSVAATRADGGVNRTDWGAKAFANIKSVIRTCQKQGLGFLKYGLSVVRAIATGKDPPLPIANPSG